ncbi:MAG TPA: phosphopantothenoylcysteine decarboxylase, partial [Pirellulaceae bacterium]
VVTVVSGPVAVEYPGAATVIRVITTEDMLAATLAEFAHAEILVAAAAPCDFRPRERSEQKIKKSDRGLELHLLPTPDILETVAANKGPRFVVGFALETHDPHANALGKLRRKHCDLMVLNSPAAIHAERSRFEILDSAGNTILTVEDSKTNFAQRFWEIVEDRFRGRLPAHG